MTVPSDRPTSPFWLTNEYLLTGQYPVARIGRVRDADATAGYLRCFDGSGWRAATINADPRIRPTFSTTPEAPGDTPLHLDELNHLLDRIAAELYDADGNLADLDEITVSTEFVGTETAALQQLRTLRRVLNERGLAKTRIGFPTSCLLTPEAFEQIADEITPFMLILTADCATRRDKLSTPTKASLTADQMPNLLQAARAAWPRRAIGRITPDTLQPEP